VKNLTQNSTVIQWKDRLLDIPAIRLGVRTFKEMNSDDGPHLAAGIAYYTILSLFPLILGLLALASFFISPQTAKDWMMDFFRQNLPTSTDLLEQNLDNIYRFQSVAGLASLVALFWTASNMFAAISRSVNRAWDIHQNRPFLVQKARHLTMAVATGLLMPLSVVVAASRAFIDDLVPGVVEEIPFLQSIGSMVITSFLSFLGALVVFSMIYKYMPNTRTYWSYILPGAILAAFLFEVAKHAFIIYLNNFANYQNVYGSLASVIILLVWIYYLALILVLGAEFSSEYIRMRRGLSEGEQLTSLHEDKEKELEGPRGNGRNGDALR
jgi:membrane protein